ncbi:hypothetical protein AB0M02_40495 [Actinoplanes sp. NPDC051861]|uniref:hypothetical protein n=1 Tax=Actinoplanes sp. NPDC051861 TaxID=3155170 RepID=UPI0034199B6C
MSLSQIDEVRLAPDGLTVRAAGPTTRADDDGAEVHVFVLVVQGEAVARGVGVSTGERWSADLTIERGAFATGPVVASAFSVTPVPEPPSVRAQHWSQQLPLTPSW